jgi:hypothetical protein
MSPNGLGKLANHDQEPCKAPLPRIIEGLYLKRFGREQPEVVLSVEERLSGAAEKKAERKALRDHRVADARETV